MIKFIQEKKFGKIIEVECGFWHSSDLDPNKSINWKRIVSTNGEYGVISDLGMHVVHIPFRVGWQPKNVRALLSKIVKERPSGKNDGKKVPCETWDNAILACDVETRDGDAFPMILSTKRIAPGHMNTWFIKVIGTEFSAEFSTKDPKSLKTLTFSVDKAQSWCIEDIGYVSAYPTITGQIFEFGFSDAILQMWAAFCDELVNKQENMLQKFICATPEEAKKSHSLFTAALESQKTNQTVTIKY